MKDVNLESNSIKDDVFIENSTSPHYPSCSTFCNVDTPFSPDSSSNELDFELMQGSDIIHDQEEGNEIIKYPFHPLSFLILHEENSAIQLTHEICLIYQSLDVQLEEP